MVDAIRQVTFEIHPGTRDGERYQIDLSGAG
jgi:hypothetical protein